MDRTDRVAFDTPGGVLGRPRCRRRDVGLGDLATDVIVLRFALCELLHIATEGRMLGSQCRGFVEDAMTLRIAAGTLGLLILVSMAMGAKTLLEVAGN